MRDHPRRHVLLSTAAVPALAWVGGELGRGRWPTFCALSQAEFLEQRRWRKAGLASWMAAAAVLTGVGPLVVARGPCEAVQRAVGPLAWVLVLQVGLEGLLGLDTDRAHPVVGATFSALRLSQTGHALRVLTAERSRGGVDGLIVLVRAQQVFWSLNLVMLATTVFGRTRAPRTSRRVRGARAGDTERSGS